MRAHTCVQLIGNCSMEAADVQRLHELIANKTNPRRTVLIVSAGIIGAQHLSPYGTRWRTRLYSRCS